MTVKASINQFFRSTSCNALVSRCSILVSTIIAPNGAVSIAYLAHKCQHAEHAMSARNRASRDECIARS